VDIGYLNSNILDERIVMVMKVDQQVADQVTLKLEIGGMIDHYELNELGHVYVTDDGRRLEVTEDGWYSLMDMDEVWIQSGSVAHLLGLPE
jgi:methyl coenzyme M reductase gamma subunit